MNTPLLLLRWRSCCLLSLFSAIFLNGCGGGENAVLLDSVTPANNSGATGTVNVSITDGPGDDFSHVWVTIKALSFHPKATAVWSSTDTDWKTVTLSAPLTIDLAALNNGQLQALLSQSQIPVGRYKQLRLFLAGTYEPLEKSATALTPTLKWNNQVQYLDSLGVAQQAPLEIPDFNNGLSAAVDISLNTITTHNAVVDIDLEHDITPFKHNQTVYFSYTPNHLAVRDLKQSGAIIGALDPAKLCPPTIYTTGCAHRVMVKAEQLSSNGTRYEDIHSTMVDPTTGRFILYPLPVKDNSGNALKYDVVVRGRNMETQIIKGVPVTAGSSGVVNPTIIQSTALNITLNSNEYTANLTNALYQSTGLVFQQTPSGVGELPHEIRWVNNDAYTGQLLNPAYLSRGSLHVANYAAGAAMTFNTVVPTEIGGAGSFSVVQTGMPAYQDVSDTVVVQAPSIGTTQSFIPADPKLKSSVATGTLSGSMTLTDSAKYFDAAYLILQDQAGATSILDVSARLSNSGTYSMSLPALSTQAIYTASLRLWRVGVKENPIIVPLSGTINLSNSSVATLNVDSVLPAKTIPTGNVTLSITDGAGDDFSHVWVTLKGMAFHTNANQAWDATDTTWRTLPFAAPITVDLNALNNGTLKNLVSNVALPVGTYNQMRLFFAETYDPLSASATALVPALKWNHQVEYLDAQGVPQQAPLEIFSADKGFKISTIFTVSSETPFKGIIDADLEHGVVPISVGTRRSFVFQPTLTHADISQSGAITGTLDPSKICFLNGNLPSCAYYVTAKAERLSADGTRYEAIHSTLVDTTNGQFALYPLPAKDAKGNALKYNVVLRGRNMETLIIKDVSVAAASTVQSSPTVLQSSPINFTVNSSEYSVDFASSLLKPTGLLFQQTLQGETIPYEMRWANNDFQAGLLLNKLALSKGAVSVASYNSGNTLSFSTIPTLEGQGSYRLQQTGASAFQSLSSAVMVTAPVGAVQTFSLSDSAFVSGVQSGTVIGTLTLTNPSNYYDVAHLIIANESRVVAALDISTSLSAVGQYAIDLPSGSTTSSISNATYYAYLRVAKSTVDANPVWIPIQTVIDLRNATRTRLDITKTLTTTATPTTP